MSAVVIVASKLTVLVIVASYTAARSKMRFQCHLPHLQALGMQCMSTEPEARPKFEEVLRLLDDLDADE